MALDPAATTGKLGIVLSGGGARGAFQAGVLEVLLGHPQFRSPAVLSGTSAGAINAAILAKTDDVGRLIEFWRGAATDQPITADKTFFEELYTAVEKVGCELGLTFARQEGVFANPFNRRRTAGRFLAAAVEVMLKSRFARLTEAARQVKQASILSGDRLRERLTATLGASVTPREGIVLAVSVVDARTGEVVRYATEGVEGEDSKEYVRRSAIPVEVICASASIPLLLPAVPVRDAEASPTRLLWDGGLLVNTPLSPVVKLGAERAVTVLCTVGKPSPSGPSFDRFDNLDHALDRLADTFFENNYNVDCKLLVARNQITSPAAEDKRAVQTNRKVYLHKAIRPLAEGIASYLDFSRDSVEKMYQHGRAAAEAWLAAGPAFEEGIELNTATPDHPLGD